MAIPIFVVVIEKNDAAFYSAYTPNIAGLSVTAESREEVERSIIEKMVQYVDRLSSQHTDSQRRLKLTTAPIAEKVSCRHQYSDSWRTTCEARAQKDGLCFQHWKQLYGHVVNSRDRFKKCVLCGEDDPLKLDGWADPCSYKAAHEDWPTTLAQKRQQEAASRKEAKDAAKRLNRTQQSRRQCAATRSQGPKGVRCSNEAVIDGLCTAHWKMVNE